MNQSKKNLLMFGSLQAPYNLKDHILKPWTMPETLTQKEYERIQGELVIDRRRG